MPRPGGGEEKTIAMVTTTTTTSAGHGYCFSDDALATSTTGHHHHVVSGQFQSFDHQSNPEIYGLTANNNNTTGGMEMMMLGFPNKNNLHQPISSTNVMWKEFFGKSSNHQSAGPSSSSSSKTTINIVPAAAAAATVGSHHEFYNQPDFSTDTTTLMVDVAAASHHHHHHHPESNTTTWQDNRVQILHHHEAAEEEEEEEEEDPSLRCVFNGRPSQPASQQGGLSLSLGSTSNINNIPSTIGLQSFELLRQQQQQQPHHHHEDIIRFGPSSSSRDGGVELFFGKSANIQQQQQQVFLMMQAENIGIHGHVGGGQFQVRSSKYLGPAQELLNEFCNLGTKQQQQNDRTKLLKFQKTTNPLHQWPQQQDQETKIQQSSNLYSLDLLELQKRKSKLLQMLEEVDRRYKHYCNQMRAVVASFEAVAGNGAASVYSALASKAMSKHFRCLRDGIVGQIKATKKALGEKDNSTAATAPGTTRGETPRLRLIDQTLRQQKAFQQMSMMESHPWRPQRGLPERAVSVLRAWLFEHFLHPYPSDVDKHILARQTGLSRSQVSNWFINARVRLWKPMVEEMYLEETKELENMMGGSSDGDKSLDLDDDSCTGSGGVSRRQPQNQNPLHHHQSRRTSHNHHQDQDEEKPTADQLVRIDSECLSSIINNNNNTHEKNDMTKTLQDELQANLHSFGRVTDSFGAMELDFSSYNHHHHHQQQQNIRSGGGAAGGVSLTLGLQQNSGVSLAFSPSASQSSLFYARENDHHINEDCTPAVVQYSLLDSEAQNLPYRNLMGAQLLHDLAG